MALPRARPAMKLERIRAADQTEFPKARPLSRSQSVWNRSALHPERKRMAETIATRTCPSPTCSRLTPQEGAIGRCSLSFLRRSEFLRQTHVIETAGRIVGEPRVTD